MSQPSVLAVHGSTSSQCSSLLWVNVLLAGDWGEDTENTFICYIMNLFFFSLNDNGTYVRFCWIPSHWDIEGNDKVERLTKETTMQIWSHWSTLISTSSCKWSGMYEVRDLFPWEMLTKMVIWCLLNAGKNWNSAQINLCSILNVYQKYVFDVTLSTEKSTNDIDADMAQNEMQLYLIPHAN